MGKTEAGEVEPQGCCYVPAAGADGILGGGRQDLETVKGFYALGIPRRQVEVCEISGLRILHSVIKKKNKPKKQGQRKG